MRALTLALVTAVMMGAGFLLLLPEAVSQERMQKIGTPAVQSGTAVKPGGPTKLKTNDDKVAELKCSGAKTKCTSKYAFVCPKGWGACTPPPGAKTCCQKN